MPVMLVCPACNAATMRRVPRTWGERLHRRVAAYECGECGTREVALRVKHCWRCGTDLDRRRRQLFWDYVAGGVGLWPYSCRRCGTRRYRWGKRSG